MRQIEGGEEGASLSVCQLGLGLRSRGLCSRRRSRDALSGRGGATPTASLPCFPPTPMPASLLLRRCGGGTPGPPAALRALGVWLRFRFAFPLLPLAPPLLPPSASSLSALRPLAASAALAAAAMRLCVLAMCLCFIARLTETASPLRRCHPMCVPSGPRPLSPETSTLN